MTFIKRNEKRLKPGSCVLFFQENPLLFQDLKNGESVEIPDMHREEVLEVFKGLVTIIKKRKSKSKVEKSLLEENE